MVRWVAPGLLLTCGFSASYAQAPPAASDPSQLPPAAPPAVVPGADAAELAPPANAREAALEERIRQLETMVNSLSGQVQRFSVSPSARPVGDLDPGTPVGRAGAPPPDGTAAGAVTPSQSGGASAPGQSLPPNPPPQNRFNSPATLASVPGSVKFGPGFEIKTDDEEFFLQFHNLTQFDYRGYQQANQSSVHNTFALPRQWWMFSGRITRPIGYFVSFQNGFDTFTGLDMFVDLNYDPRIQARIGRFKTPFTYEFLVEPIQGLIGPERSVFFNNFGQNRDVGAMAYGRVLDSHVDYAVGVFNGSRNGFVANGDPKFLSAFVNYKPFNGEGFKDSFLENLNVGGSVFTGNNNAITPVPQQLRTAVATSGNPVLGVPFLTFNNNVRENGAMTFWDLHLAYFYKQLAVIGEWGSGFQDYSLSSSLGNKTHLGVQSFYVQAGYLLTGETRSSIGIVKPNAPFDIRKGVRGPGAWELVGRYQRMDIGNQVFTNGLADPNNSANGLYLTDAGFNWHMTQYLKLYFEWEHAVFNQPVLYNVGKRQSTSDMFLVRFQLFF